MIITFLVINNRKFEIPRKNQNQNQIACFKKKNPYTVFYNIFFQISN